MAIIIDPVADMFVRIKNAISRKYHEVVLPHSNKKAKILEIIKREGYIVDFEVVKNEKTNFKEIKVTLKYKGMNQNQSAISGLKKSFKTWLKSIFICWKIA